MGFKAAVPDEAGRLPAEMAAEVMAELVCGSMTPLYRVLYDEHLAGPDFSGEVLSVPGAFSVLFGGETEDPARVEALLMEEIARLAREGVDEELFRLCKNQMYGELLAGLENVEDAATGLLSAWLRGRTPAQELQALAALTPADVNAALRATLRPQNSAVFTIFPREKTGGRPMTNHVEFPGLGLSFTLDRVAFTVFGMPVYWYGILIAGGLLLGLLFAFWKARSYGIDADRMVDVIFGATVCAIIGGRAYYVATAPFEYESLAQMVDIRLGGVGIYGAIIAAFLSGWLLCKWRRVPVLPMFDLAAMGFLIGQCIGRWGNFVNQEAFGTNTTLPWGMISENTTAYLSSVQATLAAQGVAVDPSLPVHPTFLYESLWCLAGFILLALYESTAASTAR